MSESSLIQPWQEVMDVFFNNAGDELFTNIFPLRMPGEFLAPYFNLEIDFLYIDGDHSYEGVKKDIKMWFPKVKSGGLIGGDDYGGGFVRVKQAVDEFFGSQIQIFCGNQWLTRKI